MRPAALTIAIVVTCTSSAPLLAQEIPAITQLPFREAVARAPVPRDRTQHRAARAERSAQLPTIPHVHRSVSLRRVALGALIGGATGAALGFAMGSTCGATASRQECAGYRRLGATVAGGVGVVLGVHIAAGTP